MTDDKKNTIILKKIKEKNMLKKRFQSVFLIWLIPIFSLAISLLGFIFSEAGANFVEWFTSTTMFLQVKYIWITIITNEITIISRGYTIAVIHIIFMCIIFPFVFCFYVYCMKLYQYKHRKYLVKFIICIIYIASFSATVVVNYYEANGIFSHPIYFIASMVFWTMISIICVDFFKMLMGLD